jgi:hypothetical protein
MATTTQTKEVPVAAPAQNDNIAHALAGAGGGILSTALTSVRRGPRRPD